MQLPQTSVPHGWLAFELNILRRMNYRSAVLPFCGEPQLGSYLKRWNARVSANDPTRAGQLKAIAAIENNSEFLSEDDVDAVLEDAYVPRYRLENEALLKWFNETDAWWFDNVRQNIESITSPTARAIAMTIAMSVGDYLLSFTEETREFRQPLSVVFRRIWSAFPEPVNNGQENRCTSSTAPDFIAESQGDLMFLRLPRISGRNLREYLGWTAWREEWARGGDRFWDELEAAQSGRLGDSVGTKAQFLSLVEDALERAGHISMWAVALIEDGSVSAQEIVEAIGRVRRVDTVYSKDFTELTGAKAVIITA